MTILSDAILLNTNAPKSVEIVDREVNIERDHTLEKIEASVLRQMVHQITLQEQLVLQQVTALPVDEYLKWTKGNVHILSAIGRCRYGYGEEAPRQPNCKINLIRQDQLSDDFFIHGEQMPPTKDSLLTSCKTKKSL